MSAPHFYKALEPTGELLSVGPFGVWLFTFRVPPAGWLDTLTIVQTAGDPGDLFVYAFDYDVDAVRAELADNSAFLGAITLFAAAGALVCRSARCPYAKSKADAVAGVITVAVAADAATMATKAFQVALTITSPAVLV